MEDSTANLNYGYDGPPFNLSSGLPDSMSSGSPYSRLPGGIQANSSDLAPAIAGLTISNHQLLRPSNLSQQQSSFNPSAHEFVPKSTGPGPIHHSASAPTFDMYHMSPMSQGKQLQVLLESNHHSPNLTPSGSPQLHRQRRTKSPPTSVAVSQSQNAAPNDLLQENFGGTTYFYNQDEFASSTPTPITTYPSYSVYTSAPSHLAHFKNSKPPSPFFMSDEIKRDLLSRQAAILSEVENAASAGIPSQVDSYYNLVPLDTASAHMSQFGYPSTVYKATSDRDSNTYCLRRIHGFKLTSTKCMSLMDLWKKVSGCNLVTLREVFTTKAFTDNSIVFVYDYYPLAETLVSKHFSNANLHNGYANPFNVDGTARPYSAGKGSRKASGMVNENVIWSYVIQLSAAIRTIHSAKLAIQSLHPSKILVTDKHRLRINCVGMVDILNTDPNYDPQAMLLQNQREDLMALGHLLLALACGSMLATQKEHLNSSVDMLKRSYSQDLSRLILLLLNPTNSQLAISHVMPMIGGRFYVHTESLYNKMDSLENELLKACENGRLFRILTKLNSILERKELNMDSKWSETGDRYILKLFRDYVFHQTDSNGKPWLDMAHIISSLNKLDVGTSEKICLTSKDESSIIIASYAEIKRCFEASLNELLKVQH